MAEEIFDFAMFGLFNSKENMEISDIQTQKGTKYDIPSSTVKTISAGRNHIIYCSSDEKLYGMGSNEHGQLGHNPSKLSYMQNFTLFPTETNEYKLEEIFCGEFFTILRYKNGIYHYGLNNKNYKQECIFNNEAFDLFHCYNSNIAYTKQNMVYYSFNIESLNIEYASEELPDKIKQVSLGDNFVSVLCSRSVFIINNTGVLQCIFSYAPPIISILSCSTYTLALSEDKKLWISGNIPNFSESKEDRCLASNVLRYFPLPRHIFYIDTLFNLYALGNNEYGQLIDYSKEKRVHPTQVLVRRSVNFIVGGEYYTTIILSDFNVSQIRVEYTKLTPDVLSNPLEDDDDMI